MMDNRLAGSGKVAQPPPRAPGIRSRAGGVLGVLVAGSFLLTGGCAQVRETGPAGGRVTLRLWDYRWPTAPDGTAYAQWLERQVRVFEAAHPSVEVQIHLLDPESGPAAVRRSLAEGRVPDVLGTRPGDPVLFSGRWQVPAERFLRGAVRRRYLPPALELAAAGGRVWIWPRWFVADAWLARSEPLRAAGVAAEELVVRGWSWEEAARRLRRLRGSGPLIAVPGDGAAFFRPLLAWERVGEGGNAVSRLRRLLGLGAGRRERWRVSPVRLRAATDWVRVLRAGGALPRPGSLGDQGQGGLNAFLTGRAAILAGANPWLSSLLLHRGRESGPAAGLVLLPVPTPPEEQGPRVARPALTKTDRLRLGGLAVFRPPDAADPRRLQLAAELAYFLSLRGHPWAGGAGPAFPAEREAWLRWAARSGPSAVFSAFTLHRARGAVRGMDLETWTAAEETWRALGPALKALWEGGAGPVT